MRSTQIYCITYEILSLRVHLAYQQQASSLVAAAAEAFVGDSSRHSERIHFVNYRRCCSDCAMLPGNHPIQYHRLRRMMVVCYVISFQASGIRSARGTFAIVNIYSQINTNRRMCVDLFCFRLMHSPYPLLSFRHRKSPWNPHREKDSSQCLRCQIMSSASGERD